MNLEDLFEKRLIIVTGKGGVGKTTVSLALGCLNAQYARRSIVAMLKPIRKDYPFFGLKKKIDSSERKIAKNIYATSIDANAALEEYVREYFVKPFPFYSQLFKSKTIQNFFEAAPGLGELVTIGKVWHLSNLKTGGKNPRPKYHQVIFDAPSTGHALPILNLPQKVLEMVDKGPFKTHVEWVEQFLRDPKKTLLVVVTIPEEMSIRETGELVEAARCSGVENVLTVVNCLYAEIFDNKDQKKIEEAMAAGETGKIRPILRLARSHIERVTWSKKPTQQLQEVGAGASVFIEFRFKGGLELNDINEIGSELSGQLGVSE